jgi:ribose 5-phosphate isomerase B
MKIFLAADHAGFELKERMKSMLLAEGFEVIDDGATILTPDDDYPAYMQKVAHDVALNPGSAGIIFGGSGEGEAIAANRIPGVRAAEYYGGELEIVRLSRAHNDANILSLGARFLNDEEAREAILLWLKTPFSGEARHVRRIAEIDGDAP